MVVAHESGDGGEGVASVGFGVVDQDDQDDGEAAGGAAVGGDGRGVQRPVDGFDAHRRSSGLQGRGDGRVGPYGVATKEPPSGRNPDVRYVDISAQYLVADVQVSLPCR